MKKSLALILLLLMVLPLAVACGGEKTPGDDTTTPPIVTDVTTAAPVTTAGPNLPDVKYEGYEFHFLVSGNYKNNDFLVSEDASDVINSARYTWISAAEEKYGVTISNEDVIKFGSTTGTGTGYKKLSDAYKAQDTIYDAAMIGTYDVAQLAFGGYLTDLNTLEYIDLSKDWWDQKANDDMEIQGRMFYTTGEISITDNMVTHCILFNKDMIESANVESPYDLVYADKWYFDKYSEIVKSVGEDLNGDDKMTSDDKFGLMTWNDSMLQILGSARERICTINDNDEIELTLYSDRTVSLYDQYCAFAFDSAHVLNYQYGTTSSQWNGIRDTVFDEGRAMFYTTLFTSVPRHRDSDTNFGIIPFPKFDETQSDYGHQVSAYHSQFLCVPAVIEDDEITGVILEYLAYTGKQVMTPAYYTKTLVGTQIRDDESSDMLEIIFGSRVYDIGIYYNIGTYKEKFASMFTNRNSTLTTIFETYKTRADSSLASMNENYAKGNG